MSHTQASYVQSLSWSHGEKLISHMFVHGCEIKSDVGGLSIEVIISCSHWLVNKYCDSDFSVHQWMIDDLLGLRAGHNYNISDMCCDHRSCDYT